MGSKITVIGAGNVGAAITNDIMVQGLANEVVLIDINEQKAFGEALDVYQGVPFCAPCNVHSGTYADAAGSDIVILTCGVGRKPGQTRLELAQTNVEILKSITPQIVCAAPDAIYIIVANPVDVLTYVFTKISGIPEKHIIGSGTVLDTNRLQSELARRFCISAKNVHAHVYGEHGDSSFVPWDQARIANNPVADYKALSPDKDKIAWHGEYEELEQFVKKSGGTVIAAKGSTFYAVSIATCHIVKCIQVGTGTALTVSTMLHGEYGISDVCLSVLNIVDRDGVRGKILNKLNDEELAKLQKSAAALKSVISGIKY